MLHDIHLCKKNKNKNKPHFSCMYNMHISTYLVFKWAQELCEVVEFPRVKQEVGF